MRDFDDEDHDDEDEDENHHEGLTSELEIIHTEEAPLSAILAYAS